MRSASFPMPPQALAADSMMSFMTPMLHIPCSWVNEPFRPPQDTAAVDSPLKRVLEEIARLHPKQKGREKTWLAVALDVKIQAVTNWETRGIPSRQVGAIAKLLNWPMEQVTGEIQTPSQWPFERVSFEQFDRLSERQKGVVEQAMIDAIEKVERSSTADPHSKPTGTHG